MAVPKRRHSRTRSKKRRSHDAISLARTVECPQCHEPKLPHHACPSCGTYKGREVLEVEE